MPFYRSTPRPPHHDQNPHRRGQRRHRRRVAGQLEIEGHEVEIARDGRFAFMAVKINMPDLIILDLGLPVVDGFTVLETLRSQGCSSPVLILSARGAETDKLKGFRLGADDYVTKPFGTMELMAV